MSNSGDVSRISNIKRDTKETQIEVRLNIDGRGQSDISTGIGFFDHMLTLLARHSGMDLFVKAVGDIQVDGHHTVEDVGIVVGKAIAEALTDKTGINRYGFFSVPMDETLANCALDISGRSFLVFRASFSGDRVGEFDTELAEEFFRALAFQAGITLHLSCEYGGNDHHKIEALFKAFARAFRIAVSIDPDFSDMIPSTKGVL
ncbi:MAG: imidazoleglycerol-phosphate dehydratase HisB [Clostridiaceae bacterium]|nr:imidazoleglycerol-phosphate dehydratase HisB [Clostridiaceae bacterium]